MDEDAGGLAGVPRAVRQPLVEDHEDQVAEETEEEEQLGEEQQVDVELLPEVAAREMRHINKTPVKRNDEKVTKASFSLIMSEDLLTFLTSYISLLRQSIKY